MAVQEVKTIGLTKGQLLQSQKNCAFSRSLKLTSYAQVAAAPAASFKSKDVISKLAPPLADKVEHIIDHKLKRRPIRENNQKLMKKEMDVSIQKIVI